MSEALEGIAHEYLSEAGQGDGPVDSYRLCARAKLRVVLGEPGAKAALVGRLIFVDPNDPPERQRFAAAHELAHRILRERGLPDDEWSVNWLASALIHPRAWFLARLAARGWDLAGLREDCPWSSYEAIGRRVVNVERAVLWVCDRGPDGTSSRRVRSAGIDPRLARPTAIERRLVKHAADRLEPQQERRVGAWPLPLPARDRLRVVSLAPAAELLTSSAARTPPPSPQPRSPERRSARA